MNGIEINWRLSFVAFGLNCEYHSYCLFGHGEMINYWKCPSLILCRTILLKQLNLCRKCDEGLNYFMKIKNFCTTQKFFKFNHIIFRTWDRILLRKILFEKNHKTRTAMSYGYAMYSHRNYTLFSVFPRSGSQCTIIRNNVRVDEIFRITETIENLWCYSEMFKKCLENVKIIILHDSVWIYRICRIYSPTICNFIHLFTSS